MRARLGDAVSVKTQRVVGDGKALGSGHSALTFLDFRIVKLLNLAAVQTYQMVVVQSLVELIDRLSALKMTSAQDVGLLKLCQNPIHRGQSNIGAVVQQNAKYIFRRHVSQSAGLKYFKYFQSWQGGLEAGAFEFVNIRHGAFPVASWQAGPTGPAGTMVRSYRHTLRHV